MLHLLLAACLAAAGCAGAPPATTYDLSAVELDPAAGASRPAHGELAVALPTATTLIDSQRIVIRTGSELAQLKGAQWSERLPELNQARLIESFAKSHRLAAVGRAADSRAPDPGAHQAPGSGTVYPAIAAKYTLETVIRRFEADVTHNTAHVEIYVRLLGAGGLILASQDFSGEAPSPHDDGATISTALDQALAKVLRQIVTWTTPKV